MTELVWTRVLIVVVAIFGEAPPIDLFRFFWREIRMRGVCVYEPEDFNQAIELAASGKLPLDKIITNIRPLETLQAGFEEMEQGGAAMKILLEI